MIAISAKNGVSAEIHHKAVLPERETVIRMEDRELVLLRYVNKVPVGVLLPSVPVCVARKPSQEGFLGNILRRSKHILKALQNALE